MFFENDILSSKEIFLNILKETEHIENYNVNIKVNVKQRENYVRKKIHAKKITLISLHSKQMMSVFIKSSALLNDKDFLF